MNYFDIPRISNSDLSKFKSEVILGKPYRFPEKAGQFGNELHKILFEPQLFTHPLPGINYKLLERLADKIKGDPFCSPILESSHKEHVVLFEDIDTEALCKCKVDVIQYRKEKATVILDIKTTSEQNYRSFYESTFDYDYDRQAAYYLDATGADTFVFIGVQKVKPFDVFHYEITANRGVIEYGRKKYKALLKRYVEHYNIHLHTYEVLWYQDGEVYGQCFDSLSQAQGFAQRQHDLGYLPQVEVLD